MQKTWSRGHFRSYLLFSALKLIWFDSLSFQEINFYSPNFCLTKIEMTQKLSKDEKDGRKNRNLRSVEESFDKVSRQENFLENRTTDWNESVGQLIFYATFSEGRSLSFININLSGKQRSQRDKGEHCGVSEQQGAQSSFATTFALITNRRKTNLTTSLNGSFLNLFMQTISNRYRHHLSACPPPISPFFQDVSSFANIWNIYRENFFVDCVPFYAKEKWWKLSSSHFSPKLWEYFPSGLSRLNYWLRRGGKKVQNDFLLFKSI